MAQRASLRNGYESGVLEFRPGLGTASGVGVGSDGRGAVGAGMVVGGGLMTIAIGTLAAVGAYRVVGGDGWIGPVEAAAILFAPSYLEEVLTRAILFRITEEGLGTWIRAGGLIGILWIRTHDERRRVGGQFIVDRRGGGSSARRGVYAHATVMVRMGIAFRVERRARRRVRRGGVGHDGPGIVAERGDRRGLVDGREIRPGGVGVDGRDLHGGGRGALASKPCGSAM